MNEPMTLRGFLRNVHGKGVPKLELADTELLLTFDNSTNSDWDRLNNKLVEVEGNLTLSQSSFGIVNQAGPSGWFGVKQIRSSDPQRPTSNLAIVLGWQN